ncbi:hypothetical protein BFJ63_vAg17832 [Fusarium oxysporum f. sp. narcissi]|uniref:DDE-1 domain-containing protein n=1 Tax=Fusarium oxysporum f. sp. narcissi TaxID=451672 RepID=A0A4Q2UXP0_FUSOX|nr:hypothetical protein BFJ63_vAg17832 [Fusarium oxysporum f. sp. narcissi]
MEDRASVEKWFQTWHKYVREGVEQDDIWNIDETGFQIGYLKNGIFLWTFGEVEQPILTDAHETISVTVVESISATGRILPPFIIMSGVQITARWTDNDLKGDAVLVTTPKGYIDDVVACEFFAHFERHPRAIETGKKRVLLLDGCESHFTRDLYNLATASNVVLFPLPPHLTHMLQPLDVGLFSSYKHWHQEVLLSEIADGATDFDKTDFLFHLQEIRRCSTKKSTILSSWKKCGIFPYNPSKVLDRMINPLSSLSAEVAEQQLPGYVSPGSSSSHENTSGSLSTEEDDGETFQVMHHHNAREQEISMMPSTPPKVYWNLLNTPPLKLRKIQQYERFVKLRIDCSIDSGLPLTPSVAHVNEKLRKAHTTLALNGITATNEMKRLKEKNLRRCIRKEGTSVIANYGPIRISDARLRVAKDEHNRRAAQKVEEERVRNKEVKIEADYI